MHKILNITLIITVLCFSLFITSYAAGTDYTYSPFWFQTVLNNSSWASNDSTNTTARGTYSNADVEYISINNRVLGYDSIGDKPIPCVVVKNKRYDTKLINNYIPISYQLQPNETLTFQVLLCFYTGYNPNNLYFDLNFKNSGGSNVSFNKVISLYNDIKIGDLIYNTSYPNEVITGVNPNYNGSGAVINFSYTNNTSLTQNIDSLTFYCATSTSNTFNEMAFGFFANTNDIVNLPGYVEDNLVRIGNELKSVNSSLSDIEFLLQDVLDALDSLEGTVGSAGSSSAGYYEKAEGYFESVTTPESSDVEKQEEITEKIEAEKAEQEEILNTLDEVNNYVPDEFTLDTMTQTSKNLVLQTEDSIEFKSVLSSIFFNDIFLMLIVSVFSFATAGYVLFGKR